MQNANKAWLPPFVRLVVAEDSLAALGHGGLRIIPRLAAFSYVLGAIMIMMMMINKSWVKLTVQPSSPSPPPIHWPSM